VSLQAVLSALIILIFSRTAPLAGLAGLDLQADSAGPRRRVEPDDGIGPGWDFASGSAAVYLPAEG
jgi:hypothetical protein